MISLLLTVALTMGPANQNPDSELDALVAAFHQTMETRTSRAKRSNALYRIGMTGGDQGVVVLLSLLPTIHPNLQSAAVHAISLADGDSSGHQLENLAASKTDTVRNQALRCLAHMGMEQQKWLIGRWDSEDETKTRVLILKTLLDNRASGLSSLVIRAANDDDNQLQISGLQGIGRLKLEKGFNVLRNAATNPVVSIRRAAFSALGEFGGKKAFRTLVAAADDTRNDHLMDSVVRALNSADSEEEIKVLLKALNTRDTLLQEKLLEALAAAARHQPELAADGLRRSLASNDFRVRSAAIRGMVVARPDDAVSQMTKRLGHRHSSTRTDALWALSVLGGIPEKTLPRLVELARHQDGPTRLHATAALGWFDHDTAHATCLARLADSWWAVRSAAVESLLRMRRESSVQQLIALSQRDNGRVKTEAIETLCLLTGLDFGNNSGAWRAWWSDRRPDYRLPSREVAEKMLQTARDKIIRDGDTGTYHGVTVPAGSVVFVLDTSGSMGSRYSSKETYLSHFVRALKSTLKNLPASQTFGIVLFGTTVRPWKNNLLVASEANIDAAIEFLSESRAGGGTNLFDALETALFFEDVQTVFLLTDGQPTIGKRTASSDILNEIGRLNRDLKIRINTIAAGSAAADFMSELAEDSGGNAVDLTRG